MNRARSHLPALIVALILGLVLGGGAVAAVAIPNHSVGWNKLTPGVQKRILGKSKRAIQLPAGPQGERGGPGERGERGEPGPAGPSGAVERRCEIVKGDCSIYSDEFWRLQAAYAPYEVETGVYPKPPLCLKMEAEGEPVVCIEVETYLYPDGTLGSDPWVIDPASPQGWRLYEP
jgi:hypothetical protein